jgi:hypothetical protein
MRVRTIAETLVMGKYLLANQGNHPNVWEEFKWYGISKYKLLLLKHRDAPIASASHFNHNQAVEKPCSSRIIIVWRDGRM